ncbi:universal stress protein, partial [bacterium]|nr:universal stress protein [bacterium]
MITAPADTPEPAPIVCGTDFSEVASEVSEIAAMIANALSVPLKLVFARDWLADGAAPDAAVAMDESSLSQLKEEAHQLGRTGATVDPMMSQGPPNDALIKIATDQKAQLVIVGWHGTNSRRHIESVPQLTIEYSPVPVLVIHDPERFKAWVRKDRALKIHVGADFTLSSDTALRWVKTLSTIGPCDITATYIDQPSEEEKRLGLVPSQRGEGNMIEVQKTLERDLRAKVLSIFGNNEVKTLVFGNWATKSCQLIGLAEKDDADLIVVGTHQRHGVNQ